jgi:hypothetical protein
MQGTRIGLYVLSSALGYAALHYDTFGHANAQIVLTVLFLIGMGFEKQAAGHPFFVLPPAVFSLYSLINNMLGGIVYFNYDLESAQQFPVYAETVVRGSWYTLVAIQALWVAFYALPDFKVRLFGHAEVRTVPVSLIAALTGISVFAFVAGVSLGAYGYTASAETSDIEAYVQFGGRLGWLAIVLTVIYRYETSKVLLYWIVALNVLMGLAYGHKSMAVIPVFLVVVSLYMTGRKINKGYFAAIAATLAIAYIIVEPFRVYYASLGEGRDLAEVGKLANAFSEAREYSGVYEMDHLSAFLERNNYVVPLAKTIEYADLTNYYRDEEWGNLALSPLYAVVPRFLWESKPLADFGSWASVNIFGLPGTTSIGITPQGYAYLVYRLPGVIIFFLLYGVIQRLAFNLWYLNSGFVAFYILLYLEIGYPAVVPWTYVGGTLKALFFMAPLMIWLVSWNRRRQVPSTSMRPGRTSPPATSTRLSSPIPPPTSGSS